jgi:hypothetical protein
MEDLERSVLAVLLARLNWPRLFRDHRCKNEDEGSRS